jgi:apolipoprotein D and lipocalin family protein
MLMRNLFSTITLSLLSCIVISDEIEPVENFNISKYIGKWYEIARLDHSFERGMENVSAEYSMRNDGGIKVLNRGLKKQGKPKVAEGKAYFVETANKGHLKVSFFWPFYSSYIIFELDNNYQHAFVTSDSKSYLWLLARTPCVPKALKDSFEKKSSSLGFKTSELIYVNHNCDNLDGLKIQMEGTNE